MRPRESDKVFLKTTNDDDKKFVAIPILSRDRSNRMIFACFWFRVSFDSVIASVFIENRELVGGSFSNFIIFFEDLRVEFRDLIGVIVHEFLCLNVGSTSRTIVFDPCPKLIAYIKLLIKVRTICL